MVRAIKASIKVVPKKRTKKNETQVSPKVKSKSNKLKKKKPRIVQGNEV